MNIDKYLSDVLASQNLPDDSKEMKDLQAERARVEKLIRDKFGSKPTIRYGGSKAKGTLNRESYDLDIICYFPHDDTSAGETLKDIYQNVRDCLSTQYYVDEKTSALRLKSKDPKDLGRDLHIDVVPGRYTDDSKTDCFIYQNSAEKQRLKTNLDVHIDHIKDSSVVDAIRLLKLWKVRRGVQVKQFAFELLAVKLLSDKKSRTLEHQLSYFWTQLKDNDEAIAVEDPANPEGNDLTPFLREAWPVLSSTARGTLKTIQDVGWEAVFGKVEGKKEDGGNSGANRAPAVVTGAKGAGAAGPTIIRNPSGPWASGK